MLGGASCFASDNAGPVAARGQGRVTIVYQQDAIQPENRAAMKTIIDSRVFERMADRLTKAVALPHDLEVVVTDNMPAGVDVPTTELDGRRIYWPPAFSKDTHDALAKALPGLVRDKGVSAIIPPENFSADALNAWGSQFILGHELGHALIHQLHLPLTGLEEDSADGFAIFFTIHDQETGPNAALAAAVLFDAFAKPELTIEDFSSDHAVIRQRAYNFLCAAFGSDPRRLQSLVTDGTIPEARAMMCGKEWAQLNHGWWTVLAPHLTPEHARDTKALRQQALHNLEREHTVLAAKLRQMRGQQ